jgi:hypothetical protein
MDGLFQFAVFPHVVVRPVFVVRVAFSAVVVIAFPLENLVLSHAGGGSTVTVWPLILLQLLSYSIFRMGYNKCL